VACPKITQQIIETWNIVSLGKSVALREMPVTVQDVERDKGGAGTADGLTAHYSVKEANTGDSFYVRIYRFPVV
jgi:hypothetical protein